MKLPEKKLKSLLNRIIHLEPRIYNTVRNFAASNALVSAWALEKLNRKNAENMENCANKLVLLSVVKRSGKDLMLLRLHRNSQKIFDFL